MNSVFQVLQCLNHIFLSEEAVAAESARVVEFLHHCLAEVLKMWRIILPSIKKIIFKKVEVFYSFKNQKFFLYLIQRCYNKGVSFHTKVLAHISSISKTGREIKMLKIEGLKIVAI